MTYKVCAPAPNDTVCDTAVLTVTAGAAPILTVTKTASQTPLVVGKTGQFYTITIAVANGPTTAPITVSDSLPSGITTSGAITATGGTLSGCPATGATSLAGCSIDAGAVTGNIVITVPVSVAASTVNPSTNTATVTGGGSSCPTGTNCTSTVTTPVIDAVDESATKQPNISTTTDVSTNDKYPTGSTFTTTGVTQAANACTNISMTTAGVASYTSPATEGATCTVTYKVCAPTPNDTVCDTAVLTVTASAAPSLTVTKTVSQTPLLVGKTGQFYTITIAVANGPTTAPITVSDSLPSGITTSGAITATGGTLRGCPATGATSLAGCSIDTGAVTGNIVITVPVSVAASAANPSTNTATATGGGSSCPTGTNCTSTVTTPVIDAVDESTTKQPAISTTTDVSTNDKYPTGSTFTTTGVTQAANACTNISMTTAGVASYTSPATEGATCTVTYKVCAPAPNDTVCDTAVLTVTASAAPSLTVTKTASQTPLVVGKTGQFYTITIAVANGPTTAPITVSDSLPSGITTSGAITATGGTLRSCPAAGATSLAGCSIDTGAVTGNIVITVPVSVAASTVNPSTNTATVTGGGTSCPTGTNCTSTVTTPVIDAVDESTTKQPAISTTTDVSTNDKYPTGSTFTTTGVTQAANACTNISMSTAGVATYTSASGGSSCTVTYKVCAPEPNQAVCDTATLTVNSSAAPLVNVTKTASQSTLVAGQAGQYYTIQMTISNGPTTAPMTISDTLPTGMSLAAAPTLSSGVATLTGCPSSGVNLNGCTIAKGVLDGVIAIKVPVTVTGLAKGSAVVNTATVSGGGDTSCPAAAHCTGTTTNTVDAPDMSVVPLTTLKRPVKGQPYPSGQTISCVNNGTMAATNAICEVTNLPAGLISTCTPVSPVASLAPGASIVCTISGTPTTDVMIDATVTTDTTGDSVPTNNLGKLVSLGNPKLSLTKAVTPGQLKVGASGQYYTLTMTVSDGPTLAPVLVKDDLPSGITTSGAITATGGTLTGCPAAGATNLTGCTLASGIANGQVVITVPVSVAASATTGNNTASVTGGGSECTDAVPCSASVVVAVIRPSLQVSKTVSANPLLIGADNQFYTISIYVANGPSTEPITLDDTFGPGITTSGPLVVVGGSVSGCTTANAAGATSLAGCTIAAGVNAVQIKVPVDVQEQAEGPAGGNNTVVATGGGDPYCPYATNCTGFTGQVAVKYGDLGTLFIRKEADKTSAEVGDVLTYRVTVRSSKLKGKVTVIDHLPLGFRLIAGSSTVTANGTTSKVADPSGFPGPDLSYSLQVPAVNQDVVLQYRVRVGVGAEQGDGTNRAQASMAGGRLQSMQVRVKVKVTGGVFSREACIVGKVYADCDDNNTQDKGEPGVPGVKVYLEDGTSMTTDTNGNYSICGVRAITHVLRVDTATLPKGSTLAITSNRNMGNAKSLFVDALAGQLHSTEFRLGQCSPEVLQQIGERQKGQLGGLGRVLGNPVQIQSGPGAAPVVK